MWIGNKDIDLKKVLASVAVVVLGGTAIYGAVPKSSDMSGYVTQTQYEQSQNWTNSEIQRIDNKTDNTGTDYSQEISQLQTDISNLKQAPSDSANWTIVNNFMDRMLSWKQAYDEKFGNNEPVVYEISSVNPIYIEEGSNNTYAMILLTITNTSPIDRMVSAVMNFTTKQDFSWLTVNETRLQGSNNIIWQFWQQYNDGVRFFTRGDFLLKKSGTQGDTIKMALHFTLSLHNKTTERIKFEKPQIALTWTGG